MMLSAATCLAVALATVASTGHAAAGVATAISFVWFAVAIHRYGRAG